VKSGQVSVLLFFLFHFMRRDRYYFLDLYISPPLMPNCNLEEIRKKQGKTAIIHRKSLLHEYRARIA
jgi:hypothetical protein